MKLFILLTFLPFIIYVFYLYQEKRYFENLTAKLLQCIYDNFQTISLENEKLKYITYDIETNKILLDSKSWLTVREDLIQQQVVFTLEIIDKCRDIKKIMRTELGHDSSFELNYDVDLLDDKIDKEIIHSLELRHDIFNNDKELINYYTKEHLDALLRKKKQTITYDDYKVENRTQWEKEKKYFLSKVVNIDKDDINLDLFLKYMDELIDESLETSYVEDIKSNGNEVREKKE